jgi:hypothetical protein
MPEAKTRKAAARDKREGKSASTQAGEYVREEIEHVRAGKHGARSTEQAIAIGLSKARKDGVKVPPKKSAKSTARRATAKKASAGSHVRKPASKKASAKRSRATLKALRKEGTAAASRKSLAAHARKAASKRSPTARSASAKKAARTKGPRVRSAAAKKAAKTRAAH